MVESGQVWLVDVRKPEAFAAGHLPGPMNAPIETFDARSLPYAPDRELVLYCRSGNRSAHAARMMIDAAGGDQMHLDGCFQAWVAEDLPVVVDAEIE